MSGLRLGLFLPFLKPYRWRLLAVLFLMTLGTAASLAYPLLGRYWIDHVLVPGQVDLLAPAAGALLALAAIGLGLGASTRFLYMVTAAHILTDMRAALLDHVLHLPSSTFTTMRRGELAARLHQDLVEAQRLVTDTVLQFLSTILSMLAALGLMLWLDWRLAAAALAMAPVLLGAAGLFRAQVTARARSVRDLSAGMLAYLVESLERAPLTQAYQQEDAEVGRYRGLAENFMQELVRFQWVSLAASAAPAAVLSVAGAVVLLLGGRWVAEGTLSLGTLLALTAYQLRLFGPLRELVSLALQAARSSASLTRVAELWDMATPTPSPPAALWAKPPSLAFEEVSFAYRPECPTLRGVDLHLPSGALVAMVGPNGCGKSTLIKLLVGLEQPAAGRISVDGRLVSTTEMRRNVTIVPHDAFLLHADIEVNLRWSVPEASRAQLEAAAELAGILTWIESLPEGWNTTVGERGLALSDGQKQRIALARGLLRQTQVLVLDEAVSCLDPEAQEEVWAMLRNTGRTCLVLDHRVQAARHADLVVLMQEGQVVEVGPPEESPGYRRLLTSCSDTPAHSSLHELESATGSA